MPQRMIREGLLDSDPIREAGELAEVLFTRLMLVADDYGRFDGRVTVICRRCWPLGGPSESDVELRLVALVQVGLIVKYEVDGKPFIFIPKFNQRLRLKTASKYPDPPGLPTESAQVVEVPPSNVGHATDTRPQEAVACAPEVKRSEEKGREEKQSQDQAAAQGATTVAPLAPAARASPPVEFPKPGDPRATALHGIAVASAIRCSILDAQQWVAEGVGEALLLQAIGKAKAKKPGQSVPLAFLQCFVTELRNAGGYDRDAVFAEAMANIAAKDAHVAH